MLEDTTMLRCIIGLLVTLALGLLVAPLAVAVQQGTKIPRIGLLPQGPYWEAFRQGLRDLGYVEGQNLVIEYGRAVERTEELADLVVELVRREVNLIVTWGTPATRAAKHATVTIPIVMVGIGDPVRSGLVASLAKPGGNVTGSTSIGPDLSGKRLQLLKEVIPTLSRVAVLWNPTNPANVTLFQDIQVAAQALGVTVQSVEMANFHHFESAFAAMVRERPDGLIITSDPMLQLHLREIVDFAAKSRLPAIYLQKDNVEAGGLMSYGPIWPDLFRRAANYVDKILKGANPGDLPMEQSMKFELVINRASREG
jgi:putative tryptophan/tyrosine transport system substrate-binding protein